MLLKEEEKNIYTGILGTVAFHLLVIVIFLITRLDKLHTVQDEQIVIDFDEQSLKAIQEFIKKAPLLSSDITPISRGTDNTPISQEALRNIAVNTANKIQDEISTDKYIKQVKQELGIKELNQQLDRTLPAGDESFEEGEKEVLQNTTLKNVIYKGPTRISYDLGGRNSRYIDNPVYICQGNGMVVVDIVVNPKGEVIDASIVSTSTNEECVAETALNAARKSMFEIDLKAESRQRGTISFEFVAQ
jgi:TonB family protein